MLVLVFGTNQIIRKYSETSCNFKGLKNKIQKLKENEVKDFYYGFNFLQNNFNEKILYLIRSKPNTFIKYIFYPFEKKFVIYNIDFILISCLKILKLLITRKYLLLRMA